MMLSTIARGAISGAGATLPMTLVMAGFVPFLPPDRREPLPPHTITERTTQAVGLWQRLDPEQRLVTTSLAHVGYGAASGAGYALIACRSPMPSIVSGMLYGALIWAVSYAGWLPGLRILPPPRRTTPARNLQLIVAHLAWGAVLGHLLDRRR